ncbi:MAG: 5-formyltetrahydrofolate cyclo-ligase [Nocardioides sp.]
MAPPQSRSGNEPASAASAAKIALRDQIRTSRHRRPLVEVVQAAHDLATVVMDRPEIRRAATVAAYVSIGSEPGTGVLLDALDAAGKRVILPVVQPDLDLDWGTWRGPTALVPARMGLLEPADRLGLDAVATADVVIVPGQAVSLSGNRLGQGGGCYDRALGRVPVGTPVVVCLYDDEVGRDVPVDDHDRPVTAAVTPTRWIPLR